MGDGLKRAALAALKTGTWQGKSGLKDDVPWTLTGDELVTFYEQIRIGSAAPHMALGVDRLGERKADRALQLLRKAGLIRFINRTWTTT